MDIRIMFFKQLFLANNKSPITGKACYGSKKNNPF